jgi:hypothetical protein
MSEYLEARYVRGFRFDPSQLSARYTALMLTKGSVTKEFISLRKRLTKLKPAQCNQHDTRLTYARVACFR